MEVILSLEHGKVYAYAGRLILDKNLKIMMINLLHEEHLELLEIKKNL